MFAESPDRLGLGSRSPSSRVARALGKDMATWNAGECCGKAKQENVDDVGFLIELLDHLEKELPYDRDRVYATGISNGGMMATRLACERRSYLARRRSRLRSRPARM